VADEQQDEQKSDEKPWTIEGPFAPGEMPPDMQKQWEELKRTGVTPETFTGPPEDF
jgi:hypothetical protein